MLSQATDEQTITGYLEDDHRRIDKLLADVQAMIGDGELERGENSFADADAALRRHIKLEEEIMFPIFDDRVGISGPTAVMRKEHEKILDWLDELKQSLADASRPRSATALAELMQVLTAHNQKEERILYPRTDAALSPIERRELVSRLRSG